MPYRSAKQRAYMHIHLPQITARWDREYGTKPSKFKKALKKHRERQGHARR